MFEKHFGLRENPFPAGHQMRFLYPSREHQEARAHLRYGIENREPFVLITGEVGTGKTTALYDALAEWGAQVSVALITNSALTRPELLEEICLRFGVALPAEVSKPKMLALLERHLLAVRTRGEHAVLLLDEAQNLATDLLEEIRLLSNVEAQGEKLMQIFLVGQPELEARLSRPELRQLRQRITVHYRINPLSPEETAGYIHHRISVAGGNAWTMFPPESCREVYRVTHGIPREINTVASQAMITAFSENTAVVTVEHVKAAAHEAEFNSVLAPSDLRLPTAADLAAAIATPAEAAPEPGPAAPASEPIVAPSEPIASSPEPMAAPSEAAAPASEPAAAAAPEPAPPRAAAPRAEAPPVPPPAPFPKRPPSPHADAPPAWTPEPHDRPAERVESTLREELDAWGTAASDLLRARQRAREGGVEPPAPVMPSGLSEIPSAPLPVPEPLPFPRPALFRAPEPEPRPEPSNITALPQRLRDKLEAGIEAEERDRAGALPWMIAVAVVALVLVSAMLAQRFGAIDLPLLRGFAGSPAVADSTTASQSPAATVATSVSGDSVSVAGASPAEPTVGTPAAAGGPSAGGVTAAPPPTPAGSGASQRSGTTAPATPAAPARPTLTTIYGIAAGSFLDENRAGEENARLADATGLPGRVVRYTDAGTPMYRVVLGNFTDEASAERAADRVLVQPRVREARVIVIGRTPTR